MTTLTIKINERKGLGKAIMDLLRSSAKESNLVEFVETSDKEYNQEFVKKVLKSDKHDKRVRIKTEKLWESI